MPIAGSSVPQPSRIPVHIEPSSTRIGLAKVDLELTDMWLSGHAIEGRYAIRIPLLPFKNDSGTIRLEAPESFDSLRTTGGTLRGKARSVEDDRVHDVLCRIERDGTVQITVTTEHRTLRFNSRFADPSAS
jgi:hypothetical protein